MPIRVKNRISGSIPFANGEVRTSHTKQEILLNHLRFFFFLAVLNLLLIPETNGQSKLWSLDDCINYALEQNIQIRKANVTNSINKEDLLQAKAGRLPSLSGSVRQNYDWSNQVNRTTGAEVFKGTNGTNFSVASGITVFNALKIMNSIRQSEVNYEAGKYSVEVIKESVSLNVLNAYLQVLYAGEQVNNSINQVNSTAEQLKLAEERMKLGVISNSDYLQVKSQLATEKLTLATAKSQLAINKITLMQLMDLPESHDFDITSPNLDSLISQLRYPTSEEVYQTALQLRPEVKNAELNKKSAELGVQIVKSDLYPRISLDAGISTLYSSNNIASSYGSQIKSNISPGVGISATIPIYSNRQIKTRLQVAKLATENSDLDELNTKNQLRKAIEQACQDVISSQIEYQASLEQYRASKESVDVASEKYFQGIMNSVDYLVQKTAFISAESKFLQSKYKLVFSYKILDFYVGKPLTI